MIALVYGGAASGKSEFAEQVVLSCPEPRLYIATLEPYDDESRRRIARHVERREGMNMGTLECFGDIAGVDFEAGGSVILECLGNMVGNTLYNSPDHDVRAYDENGGLADGQPDGTDREQGDVIGVERHVDRHLDRLMDVAGNLVFVGNDVFRSGEEYEGEMQRYLEVLASAMRHVAERADLVVEVVCGVPVLRKGHLEPGSQLESVYLETGALV